jgi:glycosyltransferase involved in cell wall biosynthesis
MPRNDDPVAKDRRLLVAIPCLNEEATIADVILHVPRLIDGIGRVDVVVIDDGSVDRSADEARRAGAMVVRHSANRGVGMAFQSAVRLAVANRYDLMVNIDGDRQFNPEDIPKLIAPILEGEADMATASRFLEPARSPKMPRVKLIGNHMMSTLISRLVRHKFADVSCGFRCYSREALLHLNLHGAFTYTQETFLDFAVKNLGIKEIPIDVTYFKDRKSRVAGNIWRYGVNAATIIFRGYRDYFPLRFFVGLATIFAIPGIALASLFFGNYLLTGRFSGYLFAGFGSAFLLVVAMIFVVLGVVTDMLDRIRSNQERILYLLKKSGAAGAGDSADE